MKRLRTVLIALGAGAVIFSLSRPLSADDFSDNLAAHLDKPALDALAQDVGALVGGSSFHSGKTLGFPLGVDLGIHESVAGLNPDDAILRDNRSTDNALSVQAEYGLPGNLNLLGRYGRLHDANFVGGGLRVSLWKSQAPFIPDLSVTGLYDRLGHTDFHAHVYTANFVASFDIPFIHPYLGIGYDSTQLDVKGRVAPPSGSANARSGHGNEYRAEAGVNLSLIPFTYISLGGGLTNGRKLGHVGLGVRF